MTTNLVRPVFTLLTLVTLLAACSYKEQRESHAHLTTAAQAMEGNPQQAKELLRAVQGDALSDADYAYYVLLQARVEGMNGTNLAPMELLVGTAKDYFEAEQDAPNTAFAYFVLGRVCEAQESPTRALHCYLRADDWARKCGNRIPNFTYSNIPYNIASYCNRKGNQTESLLFLDKALAYIEANPSPYIHKLYALELKARNYQDMGRADSALYYFDTSLSVAQQHSDTVAANRIRYNKYTLLHSKSDDYAFVEEKCNELLPTFVASKDSLLVGMMHMALARVYAHTNRIGMAVVSIHKAEKLLGSCESYLRLILYERLYLIEQQKGNKAEASRYRQQYNDYKSKLEAKRTQDKVAIEAEQQKLAAFQREDGEYLFKKMVYVGIDRATFAHHKRQGWLILGALVVLIGGIYGLRGIKRELRENATPPSPFPAFCREELLAYARRSEGLNAIRRSARHRCPSIGQVGRVAYMLDDLVPPDDWNWRRLLPTASCSYAELLGMLRRDFPQLNEKELDICALLYTQRLKARQMADIVHVELPEFKEHRKSMKHKLQEAGYTSRRIRKYVERRIK